MVRWNSRDKSLSVVVSLLSSSRQAQVDEEEWRKFLARRPPIFCFIFLFLCCSASPVKVRRSLQSTDNENSYNLFGSEKNQEEEQRRNETQQQQQHHPTKQQLRAEDCDYTLYVASTLALRGFIFYSCLLVGRRATASCEGCVLGTKTRNDVRADN